MAAKRTETLHLDSAETTEVIDKLQALFRVKAETASEVIRQLIECILDLEAKLEKRDVAWETYQEAKAVFELALDAERAGKLADDDTRQGAWEDYREAKAEFEKVMTEPE